MAQSFMNLLQSLKDGQVIQGKLGHHGADGYEWIYTGPIHLAVKRHNGRVVLIKPKDRTWAEYTPENAEPDFNTLVAGDCIMEISKTQN